MRGTIPERRLPVGAEVVEGGVHFRVWAPVAKDVEVVLEDVRDRRGLVLALATEGNDYFSGRVDGIGPGTRYRYRIGQNLYPDPASRYQPEGPQGPSEVIDPAPFAWTDTVWRGVPHEGQVLYEMHIGTFTPEGTWEAAAR